MLNKILVGCSLAGVCLLIGCSDGNKTIIIISAGGALGTGGAQTSGGAAQGGSAPAGGNGSGGGNAGGSQGGSNPGTGGVGTGGSPGSGGLIGTSGASGSTGTSGSGGATVCNSVGQGYDVYEQNLEGYSPPAMTGGQLFDGTYELAIREDYDGTCDCAHNQRFVLSGGGTLYQSNLDGNTSTATVSVSGNVLTLTNTCPTAGAPSSQMYTATPAEIQIYTSGDLRVDYFTRTGP